MAVIAHWLAWPPSRMPQPVVIDTTGEVDQLRDLGWTVEGPFVPEADLRGAVSTAAEVAGDLCALAEEQPGNPHDELSTRLYEIVRKLDRRGGQ